MDIRRQTFKRTFKGFDPDEVQAYLDMMAGRVEEFERGKKDGEFENARLKGELEKYEKLEKVLHDMLLQAQQSIEETKKNAEKQAELIVREAEYRATQSAADAVQRLEAINRDMALLHEQKKTFIIKFRALVKSQLEMLNVLEIEPETQKQHGEAQ